MELDIQDIQSLFNSRQAVLELLRGRLLLLQLLLNYVYFLLKFVNISS